MGMAFPARLKLAYVEIPPSSARARCRWRTGRASTYGLFGPSLAMRRSCGASVGSASSTCNVLALQGRRRALLPAQGVHRAQPAGAPRGQDHRRHRHRAHEEHLGAVRAQVLRLVVREGTVLAATGVVLGLGLGLAFALTRFLRTMLFEVAPTDPATYIAIVAVLAGAALVASWIPARAAAGVDPAIALRRE